MHQGMPGPGRAGRPHRRLVFCTSWYIFIYLGYIWIYHERVNPKIWSSPVWIYPFGGPRDITYETFSVPTGSMCLPRCNGMQKGHGTNLLHFDMCRFVFNVFHAPSACHCRCLHQRDRYRTSVQDQYIAPRKTEYQKIRVDTEQHAHTLNTVRFIRIHLQHNADTC